MFYCKKCVTPSTRPRVTFDKNGVCNACNWNTEKAIINWEEKREHLEEVCNLFRRRNYWDVIVPCSGGKDGSYVAWKLKHEFGMHPLCVTFSPPLQTELGRKNLEAFRNSGFTLLEIRPNPDVYRKLCKRLFIEQARSKFPFVIGIATSVMKIALHFHIPFIMWGEEGETEYGGAGQHKDDMFMTYDYMINYYHEGIKIAEYINNGFLKQELWWWLLPEKDKINEELRQTWWSKWEPWDDQLHRNLAIEKCGLTLSTTQTGTFTNYAQLDDILQDLHVYEGFIKYGHGRATGDCNLAIHAGRMSRETAVKIVKEKDGVFPIQYLAEYLNFFDMSEAVFWKTIDRHANKTILTRTDDKNRPWIVKEPIC